MIDLQNFATIRPSPTQPPNAARCKTYDVVRTSPLSALSWCMFHVTSVSYSVFSHYRVISRFQPRNTRHL